MIAETNNLTQQHLTFMAKLFSLEERCVFDGAFVSESTITPEVLIIDTQVKNFTETPIKDVPVFVVEQHHTIEDITRFLQQFNAIDLITIIAHGNESQLHLGATIWGDDASDSLKGELQAWRPYLTDTADIHFYVCEWGNAALNNEIAAWTGADILATSQIIKGDSQVVFDKSWGEIDKESILRDHLQDYVKGVLAPLEVVSLTTDPSGENFVAVKSGIQVADFYETSEINANDVVIASVFIDPNQQQLGVWRVDGQVVTEAPVPININSIIQFTPSNPNRAGVDTQLVLQVTNTFSGTDIYQINLDVVRVFGTFLDAFAGLFHNQETMEQERLNALQDQLNNKEFQELYNNQVLLALNTRETINPFQIGKDNNLTNYDKDKGFRWDEIIDPKFSVLVVEKVKDTEKTTAPPPTSTPPSPSSDENAGKNQEEKVATPPNPEGEKVE